MRRRRYVGVSLCKVGKKPTHLNNDIFAVVGGVAPRTVSRGNAVFQLQALGFGSSRNVRIHGHVEMVCDKQ
jgi:hypothetical protein